MNILFYGNCQLYAIKQILNLQNVHQSLVECFTTDISLEEFDILIKNSDVIITQHINDNYSNAPSTLDWLKPNAIAQNKYTNVGNYDTNGNKINCCR